MLAMLGLVDESRPDKFCCTNGTGNGFHDRVIVTLHTLPMLCRALMAPGFSNYCLLMSLQRYQRGRIANIASAGSTLRPSGV